jgi:hypothetical protein
LADGRADAAGFGDVIEEFQVVDVHARW